MTLQQAKKVAGVRFDTTTEEGLFKAERHCKDEIVKARELGDDNRAAELSEAKEVFKKLLRRFRPNSCEVCGATIAARATRCRLHQQNGKTKALPLPPGFTGKQPSKRAPGKKRRFSASTLAQMGYWSSPVQSVVKKWLEDFRAKAKQNEKLPQKMINREGWFQHYLAECFYSVFHGDELRVRLASKGDQGFVIELLGALQTLYSEKGLARWVLETCNSGSANYDLINTFPRPDSVAEIRARIQQISGLNPTIDAIEKQLKRLRLNDPTAPLHAPLWCGEILVRDNPDRNGF